MATPLDGQCLGCAWFITEAPDILDISFEQFSIIRVFDCYFDSRHVGVRRNHAMFTTRMLPHVEASSQRRYRLT
jgi:hypothetical protein